MRNYHQENEIFFDPECHGCCHSLTASCCAGDGRTVSPSRLLPFSCCVAAQRLNLVTFLIVVKRPGDRPCPFSDLNNTQTLCPPLCPGSGAYIHVSEQQHFRAQCVFLWLSQRLLKPSTCIDPPPISLLSRSHPPLFACLKQYSLSVVIDSRRLGHSKCSFESVVILSNCSNSR